MKHIKLNNKTVDRAENYIKMVAQSTLNKGEEGIGLRGCVLLGPPGMGKTWTVLNVLKEMGLKEDKDFKVFGGHISLAQTYEYLYENSDKLIFFDDVSQVISSKEIMEMIKQALNTSGRRMLHYRSTNVLNRSTPNQFEFTGQIIFACNLIETHNENVRAILDRAPITELKFSRKEIIAAMYQIAAGNSGSLLEYEKMIVTKEIEENTGINSNISLRKQMQSFQIYSNMKSVHGTGNTEWISLVRGLFGKKKMSWMEELLRELCGEGKIYRPDLVREICERRDCSPRTADRRITEHLEIGLLYSDKKRDMNISLLPFSKKKVK